MVRNEAPQSLSCVAFCVYLASLKGAEVGGFIYRIAQFPQDNWYTKTVCEDLICK